MSDQNWRTDIDGGDYFLHQKKKAELADRRPVIRNSADLVGPGIGASAVRLDEFNDLLATFNGYYASEAGAGNAPTADEAFIGQVISDATLGGQQIFTGLTSGSEYRRTFLRSPVDAEAISWGAWVEWRRTHASASTGFERDTTVLSGSASLLRTPILHIVGQSGTYEATEDAIKILRSGVYTGSIQVGDRVGTTTLTTLAFYQPQGNTTRGLGQLNVPMGPTVHIPFTLWADDGLQGFSVAVIHEEAEARDLWWRFYCTRVGDVV